MNQEVLEIVLKILETKKVQELVEKLVNLFLHRKIKSHDLLAFLFMHKWMFFIFTF